MTSIKMSESGNVRGFGPRSRESVQRVGQARPGRGLRLQSDPFGDHRTGEFRLLAANDAAIALYRWQATTIQTKALDDLTVSEDTIRLYAELSGPAPAPGGHSFRYECGDGQSMFLEFRCCRINHEGSDALLLSISDVTEARLLGSKLVRLLEAFPDLVCTFDRSNHFVDVSTSIEPDTRFRALRAGGPHGLRAGPSGGPPADVDGGEPSVRGRGSDSRVRVPLPAQVRRLSGGCCGVRPTAQSMT